MSDTSQRLKEALESQRLYELFKRHGQRPSARLSRERGIEARTPIGPVIKRGPKGLPTRLYGPENYSPGLVITRPDVLPTTTFEDYSEIFFGPNNPLFGTGRRVKK